MCRSVIVEEQEAFIIQKKAYYRVILIGFTVLLATFASAFFYCHTGHEMPYPNGCNGSSGDKRSNSTDADKLITEMYQTDSAEKQTKNKSATTIADEPTNMSAGREGSDITDDVTLKTIIGNNGNNNIDKTVNVSDDSESIVSQQIKFENISLDDDPIVFRQFYKYIALGATCRIPNISPVDHTIRGLIPKLAKPMKCSAFEPLTEITYDLSSNSHVLRVIPKNLPKNRANTINSKLRCCYSIIMRKDMVAPISRNDDHNRFSIQNHTCFDDSIKLPFGTEYIYVACSEAETGNQIAVNGATKQFYKNVHAIIPKKPTVKHRKENSNDESFVKSVITPNVLIIGVHSVSRLGLLRAMPEIAKYLKDNGWAELVGYTKTGTDTFQNLIPLLTGLNYAQLTQQCWNSPFESFDDCPFIWKDFKRKSYVTAFAEDQAQMSAFNHYKYGFFNAPTDFYTRAFVLASERLLLDDHHGGIKFCLGPIPAAEHVLKYALDFAETFHNEPHFGFFWMDTFTKGDVDNPAVMDNRMKRFFLDLERYLNSTFVLFLSDHGTQYGDIRQTYVGWLEERTPFNYLWIPPYFRHRFPRKYRNFSINKNRLVSAFDLYLTLQDILHNCSDDDDDNDKHSNISAAGCETCSSLFRTIKWDRTCEEAGIPSNWCICEAEFTSVPLNNYTIEVAAKFTVDYINRLLRSINNENGNSNGTCATLSLKRVISARRRLKFHTNTAPEYIVILETAPNNAIYEVTIKGQNANNFTIIGTISRLNSHNPDSECAANSESAKYCTCAPKNE